MTDMTKVHLRILADTLTNERFNMRYCATLCDLDVLCYCRERMFVAGFYDSCDLFMRQLCGIFSAKVFAALCERTLGLCFVQQYRTFENYYAGCRWIAIL